MRGADQQQSGMFSYISAERRVPKEHPLRTVRIMVDAALKELGSRFDELYASGGRPSIAPEKLLRALLLQVLYTVRSERMLMEQLDYNFLFLVRGPEHRRSRVGRDDVVVDEKSQIQTLERTQPVLPMGLGYVEGVTHDYYRHGTTTLFAALNVLDGAVITQCKPRHRHQEFLAFLNHLDHSVPADLEVHLIVDNYATHKHPGTRRILGGHGEPVWQVDQWRLSRAGDHSIAGSRHSKVISTKA